MATASACHERSAPACRAAARTRPSAGCGYTWMVKGVSIGAGAAPPEGRADRPLTFPGRVAPCSRLKVARPWTLMLNLRIPVFARRADD